MKREGDIRTQRRIEQLLRRGEGAEDPAEARLVLNHTPEVRLRLRKQARYTLLILGAAGINVVLGLMGTPAFLVVGCVGVLVASMALLQQRLLRKRLWRAERLNYALGEAACATEKRN